MKHTRFIPFVLVALAACSTDDSPTAIPDGAIAKANYAVVVNSIGQSMTIISTDSNSVTATVPLAVGFDGIDVAARGRLAVTTESSLQGSDLFVVNLNATSVASAVTRIDLPDNLDSGPANFADDDHVYVPSRAKAMVLRITLSTGKIDTVATSVARAPSVAIKADDRIAVLDGNHAADFSDFQPGRVILMKTDGTSRDTVSVAPLLDLRAGIVTDSRYLTVIGGGTYSGAPTFAPLNNGYVATIDLRTDKLVGTPVALGKNGGSIAVAPNGQIYVTASEIAGVMVYDPVSNAFTHGPAAPLALTVSGSSVTCDALTTGANHDIWCVISNFGAPSTVHHFDASRGFLGTVSSGDFSTGVATGGN